MIGYAVFVMADGGVVFTGKVMEERTPGDTDLSAGLLDGGRSLLVAGVLLVIVINVEVLFSHIGFVGFSRSVPAAVCFVFPGGRSPLLEYIGSRCIWVKGIGH
ncbi:hypothetical protein [Arthrobacter sp. H14]|uniref:hypothetical protein n=1 Tax=Arthrobacter sp. H14 TaxID=1312959 RepID=UPI00047CA063|nr:hypothetical protein [Arthrobacter sp. H14]